MFFKSENQNMSKWGVILSECRRNTNKTIKNMRFNKIKKIGITLIVLYILLCVAAVLIQGKVIFPVQKLSDEAVTVSTKTANVESLQLQMKDGVKLRGWLIKNSISAKSNLLIYFGANAEEVSTVIPRMSKFQNWSIALINYRGYGSSEGIPGEKALCSDSLEIYDYFSKKSDINNNNIVIMGRSIGTGIATYLAAKRNVTSVILVSPYDSLTSVAREKCPILPFNILLKDKFNSINLAPTVKSPLFILVGSKDKLIPPWHSKKLGKAWGGKVKLEEITGAGHNSIDDGDNYWNKVYEFLSTTAPSQ